MKGFEKEDSISRSPFRWSMVRSLSFAMDSNVNPSPPNRSVLSRSRRVSSTFMMVSSTEALMFAISFLMALFCLCRLVMSPLVTLSTILAGEKRI